MHAIIFDIDGTLLQSASVDDSLYRQAVRHVLGPVKFRESLEHYHCVSDSGILSQVLTDNQLPSLPDPTPDIVANFVGSLEQYIAANGPFREIPGAKQFLAKLRSSADHFVALATGGWAASATLKLRSAGFDLNNITLSASDHEPERTRIMQSALDRPESQYKSITYYGDGPWDRAACGKLGWDFVAVGSALGGLESYADI